MKIPLLISFLTIPFIVSGRLISETEAKTIAVEFFKSDSVASSSKSIISHRANGTLHNDATSYPIYVFNRENEKGFIIISNDNRTHKIIGYSHQGNLDFDNVPPQLADMLNKYAECITSLPMDSPVHPSWDASEQIQSEDEDILLETANWGQDAPYNSQCPIIDGTQAPTGCVATAMAIIMEYHSWPNETQGKKYANFYNQDFAVDYSTEKINWDKISVNSEEGCRNLGRLMAITGNAVDMQYGQTESSSLMPCVGHELTEKFKFSPQCQFITKQNFNNDEWRSLLDNQLIAGNPVIYSGNGSGSHAFIVDGKQSEFYHINWGWDGAFNGYFILDSLNPGDADFSNDAGMVINIIPDSSGKQYSRAFLDYGYLWIADSHKFNISCENIEPGIPFAAVGPILTYPYDYDAELRLALIDNEDNIISTAKNLVWSIDGVRIDNHNGTIIPKIGRPNGWDSWIFPEDVPIKDNYRVAYVTREDGEPWKLVLGTIECPGIFPVKGNQPKWAKLNIDYDSDKIILEPNNFTINTETAALIHSSHSMTAHYKYGETDLEIISPADFTDYGYYVDIDRDPWILSFTVDVEDDISLRLKYTPIEKEYFELSQLDNSRNVITPDGVVYSIDENCLNAITIGLIENHSDLISIPEKIEINGKSYIVSLENISVLSGYSNIRHVDLSHSYSGGMLSYFSLGYMPSLESICVGANYSPGRYVTFGDCNLKSIYVNGDLSDNLLMPLNESKNDLEEAYISGIRPFCSPQGGATHCRNIYVPGETFDIYAMDKESLFPNSDIREMWKYRISTTANYVKIEPLIEGININKVTIDGKVTQSDNNLYHFTSTYENAVPEIMIDYTINGLYEMTTVYDVGFNSFLPDDGTLTSISDIDANATFDLYNMQGILISRNCSGDDLKRIEPSVYVIRQGAYSKKVLIR